jgi:hypothetical protein
VGIQEYLAHQKAPPPRTLHHSSSWGPMVFLGSGAPNLTELELEDGVRTATRMPVSRIVKDGKLSCIIYELII